MERIRRMIKKAVQRGRSEQRGETYSEPLSDARTKLGEKRVLARRGLAGEKGDFFSILLGKVS